MVYRHTNKKTGHYSSYKYTADKVFSKYMQDVRATVENTPEPDEDISIESLKSFLHSNINSIIDSASNQLFETAPSLINKLGAEPLEVFDNVREMKEYWKTVVAFFFSQDVSIEKVSKTAFNISVSYVKNGYPVVLISKGFKALENKVLQFLVQKNECYDTLLYYQFVHSRFDIIQLINKQALTVAKKNKITKFHYISDIRE